MAGVTKIPQKVASHHRNQTPHTLEPPPLAPPPKKPSRWLKRKNPSLPIIIGRSGTSPDDQAHWQPLRFFTFILSSRKAAVSTRRKRHDSIFTSLLKSRPVGPLPRRHRQTQPCRLASSNAPITVHACSFRCTRGSHKLLGRHEHAAIQAPTTPRWTPPCPPFVPCCARSPPSPTLRWRRLFLCLAPSRLCRPSQKGNRKSPKRGPARTRSRRGNPSSLGRYHPGADRNPRPLAVDTAHPAGRKPVRSRQRSLSNFCPHGTRELLDRRGVAAASTVKSH